MATVYKVLGQAIPGGGVLTPLYTATGVTAVISSIACCNQAPYQSRVRVSVSVAAATDTPAQYIVYDLSILPNDSYIATIGLTLANTDVLRVQSDTGCVSFNAFGSEIS